MHAVPSELQAAHEEGKIKYLRREEVKKKQNKKTEACMESLIVSA